MRLQLICICFCLSSFWSYSQIVSGQIENFSRKAIQFEFSNWDTTGSFSLSTDIDGRFRVVLPFNIVTELTMRLNADSLSFFITDSATIVADYRNFDRTVKLNGTNPFVKKNSYFNIIDSLKVNSFDSIPSLMKGKLTLLEIWSTGCGPCLIHQRVNRKYDDEYQHLGVQYLYVSLDLVEYYGKWRRFIKDHSLIGTHIFPNRTLYHDIVVVKGYNSMPTYFVIDKHSKIHQFVFEHLDDEDFYASFERYQYELLDFVRTIASAN